MYVEEEAGEKMEIIGKWASCLLCGTPANKVRLLKLPTIG